jgi:tRNA G18 (ribose-2'-O)-methylase SpoU
MEEDFVQQRHKPPAPLDCPRELIVACAPMRSNVNLSRIVRAAGCFGVERVVCCGSSRPVGKIARDAARSLRIEIHRTLIPVLKRLREDGFQLVGLEQTPHSQSLYTFPFRRRTVLVVGNERLGLEADVLGIVDTAVEIPVYALPYAHNAATAATIAIYEYCRQYPRG